MSLACPVNMLPHVRQVFAGEYDVSISPLSPVILDIGANVGAFTVWASRRWPGSLIHSYEPILENFKLLVRNLAYVNSRSKAYPVNCAVLNRDVEAIEMKLGLNNTGESGLYDLGEQSEKREIVRVVQASSLPQADVIKIDTEGCEVEILEGLDLSKAKAIMLEVHRNEDRAAVLMRLMDFEVACHQQIMRNRWLIKLIRQ